MIATSLTHPTLPAAVYGRNPPLLLWSTNTYFKFRVQQDFLGGRHYVWCSPEFEGAKLGKYQLGSAQPSSSDPGTIYRLLKHSIKTGDQHDSKIVDQKASMKALSVSLAASGKISVSDRDEIVAMVDASNLHDWRPLIYVIPYALVATRAKLVDRSKRASNEPEYIIDDLVDGEFRIIEPESGI